MKLETGRKLWTKENNVIFRRSSEQNPGIPICSHIFLRAISYSQELLHSTYVGNAIHAWKKHQLENGILIPTTINTTSTIQLIHYDYFGN